MILYLKDPKNSTRKLLNLQNTFGKIAGYKSDIQKSEGGRNTQARVFFRWRY
jgi:hypothetical protein